MTAAPVGMAPVFAGWNVWDVYQADSPDENLLGKIWHAGITEDQLLKLWVENQVEDNASGANISDPANPNPEHFRGDSVQIIASASTLGRAAVRDSIPELAGAQQLGTQDSTARLRTVRFYNRGSATVMPWPHDQNFLVDVVFQPDAKNPLTNAPAPTTFGGSVAAFGSEAAHAIETLAWVVGGAAALFFLFKLRSAK